MSARRYRISPRGGAGIEEKHLSTTTLKKISGIQATRNDGRPASSSEYFINSEQMPMGGDETDSIGTMALGDESLCDWLWNETVDLRKEAFHTGFIQGIANGNLDPNYYGGYTVQDAIYCAYATDNLGIAKTKARDAEVKKYIEGQEHVLKGYTKLMFDTWHIKSLEGIELGSAVKDYADYEREVAKTMGPVYYLIAMLPCYRLWPWLANEILKQVNPVPATNVYKFWVDDNSASSDWQNLQVVIDQHAEEIEKATAQDVFRKCMQGEVSFFSSAVPK